MFNLKGYEDFELISETLNAIVYRARSTATGDRVVIKILRVENPSSADIARFKHEYNLIRKMDLDEIVKVLDIVFTGDRFALIMEDFGGISLKNHLKGALALDRFLDMAIRLVALVQKVHQCNITHQDLKPGNILYNPATDVLKLADFGIAAENAWTHQDGRTHKAIEGSLLYMSPEQTGRMNCGVDYRTDFYSLGVTFYEMLTGGVPFTAEEPMEIIHGHIAKMPVPPHQINPGIPTTVSDIIMRLLAKSAEARYQSSQGLLIDLEACRKQLKQTGRIERFTIGRQDISPKFHIPQMLVGREDELKTLHETFERVSAEKVGILMVSGEPGIGKSALVNEIHKPIAAKRGYFIAGKYDQLRQSVPFSGIIQAVQGLARQLLSESEDRLTLWKKKLLEALGLNGKVMTDIIAELELIIGRQPEIPELLPEEYQNRFKMVLKNFFCVFADQNHPLVLFLDDLQWADPASIDLIQTLILNRDLHSFLLIGAYRDNEVAEHHPLMLALDRMLTAHIDLTTISLKSLHQKSTNCLLAGFLRCSPESSDKLAAIIHKKTLGNPFFINQFLKRLYEDNYLSLDPSAGWQWDTAAVQNMQVTENVVGFMAEKLRNLQTAPLNLIKIAACIGNRFDIQTLAAVSDNSMDAVLDTIDTLVQEGLINYRNRLYRFHHDRIQEASYSLLGPEEKERLHYHIGRLALENTPKDNLSYHVFYIADQLNHAHGQLKSREECLQLADINLTAGIKAKDATAYDAAVAYLAAGIELLPEKAWQTDYALTYTLHAEQMECQYLARNFDDAERLFKIIVANASGKIDKANAYSTMVTLYTNTRPPEDAIVLGLSALRLFGIKLSLKTGPLKVLWELIKVKLNLRKISLEEILELPPMTDAERRCYHDLLLKTAPPVCFVNPYLFALIVLKGFNESLKYGLPSHAAVTFGSLAIILESVLGDYQMGFKMGKMALRLDQKMNDKKLSGMVHHVFAHFVQHWNRHAKHDLPVYRKVYQLCLDHGDFIFAGHSINASTDCRLCIGEPLDSILKDIKKYRGFINQIKDPWIGGIYRQHTQLIRTLKGLNPPSAVLSGQDNDETALLTKLRADKHMYGLCFTLLPKIRVLYLFGRYDAAISVAEEVDRHIQASMGTLTVSEHYFYYSLILTALLALSGTPQKSKIRRIIARNQRKLGKWAAVCPENFRHKHDLVMAELTAGGPQLRKTLDYYHAAVKGAHENEYFNEEALACERLALFYHHRLDALDEARVFMQRAFRCYGYWGATAKQKHIEETHAMLLTNRPYGKKIDGADRTSTTQTTSRQLDLATVMQVSQAISSEIMLDQLLKKTMQISITNAGAQRGFLILASDGNLTVEVYEDPNQKERKINLPLPLTECRELCQAIVNFVSRSREPVILANAVKEGPFVNDPYIAANQSKSILCMPILNKGQLSGILYMENNLTANAFTSGRLEILSIIASQTAISLDNARLFKLATTDGLTKLFVHRYFQLLLDQEIRRSSRYDRPFSLVMMDIDNFKHFNDNYGHQLGDDVLKRVARVLTDNTRTVDIAARYGGEEFVLILPETDLPQSLIVCEKIRGLIEAMSIPYGEQNLKVTISLGVATYPHHATAKDALIASADSALYTSKRAGKNRVSVGKKFNHTLKQNTLTT